jgi:hypothetical protein
MYRHAQTGRIYLWIVLAVVALQIFTHQGPLGMGITIAVVAVCAAFARLTTEVGDGRLRWAMTFGWPGGNIPLDRIAGAEIVPVRVGSSIGIHLTPMGWVWNVALGRGVRVSKAAGRSVVIGTDDPEGLLAALTAPRPTA